MSDNYIGMRKLAAAVMTTAAKDLMRAVNAGDYNMYSECRKFLMNDSVWHQILNIDPDYVARWVNAQPRVRRRRVKLGNLGGESRPVGGKQESGGVE